MPGERPDSFLEPAQAHAHTAELRRGRLQLLLVLIEQVLQAFRIGVFCGHGLKHRREVELTGQRAERSGQIERQQLAHGPDVLLPALLSTLPGFHPGHDDHLNEECSHKCDHGADDDRSYSIAEVREAHGSDAISVITGAGVGRTVNVPDLRYVAALPDPGRRCARRHRSPASAPNGPLWSRQLTSGGFLLPG